MREFKSYEYLYIYLFVPHIHTQGITHSSNKSHANEIFFFILSVIHLYLIKRIIEQ